MLEMAIVVSKNSFLFFTYPPMSTAFSFNLKPKLVSSPRFIPLCLVREESLRELFSPRNSSSQYSNLTFLRQLCQIFCPSFLLLFTFLSQSKARFMYSLGDNISFVKHFSTCIILSFFFFKLTEVYTSQHITIYDIKKNKLKFNEAFF